MWYRVLFVFIFVRYDMCFTRKEWSCVLLLRVQVAFCAVRAECFVAWCQMYRRNVRSLVQLDGPTELPLAPSEGNGIAVRGTFCSVTIGTVVLLCFSPVLWG